MPDCRVCVGHLSSVYQTILGGTNIMDTLDKIICRLGIGLMVVGLFLSIAVTQEGSRASASPAAQGSQASSKLSGADQQFIKNAAEGGLAEVELGQLALQKASSREVKNFGRRMVDDHGKANDELKRIAASKGLDLPQKPAAKNKATKDRLGKLSGQQFDNAYMAEMLKDHKEDVAEFRRKRKTARDEDVRNFAVKTLPTLESHLKQAEKIAPELTAERSALQKAPGLQKPSPAIAKSRSLAR
jgi:putative membrane protein